MFAPLYLISIMGLGVTALLVLLFIILVVSNIIIVPQASAYVIERLGAYQQTWGTQVGQRPTEGSKYPS